MGLAEGHPSRRQVSVQGDVAAPELKGVGESALPRVVPGETQETFDRSNLSMCDFAASAAGRGRWRRRRRRSAPGVVGGRERPGAAREDVVRELHFLHVHVLGPGGG